MRFIIHKRLGSIHNRELWRSEAAMAAGLNAARMPRTLKPIPFCFLSWNEGLVTKDKRLVDGA